MASRWMHHHRDASAENAPRLGRQPFNRDNIDLAFRASASEKAHDGQALAGTGALVFEGELLEFSQAPQWH